MTKCHNMFDVSCKHGFFTVEERLLRMMECNLKYFLTEKDV